MELRTPWLKNYGKIRFELEYPDYSMFDSIVAASEKYPSNKAISYMGRVLDFTELVEKIEQTAKAYYELGIRKGDIVTICMPNVPQAIYSIYALNRIGAVAANIHPLSAVGEIKYYLDEVKSDYVLTLDQFYNKLVEVEKLHPLKKIIIASAGDELGFFKKIGFKLTAGRKNPKVKDSEGVINWKTFIKNGKNLKDGYAVNSKGNDVAVILFSGGTTGTTKAIQLSNLNFNALAIQTAEMSSFSVPGKKLLAAMPIFHGFGLGVCVHTALLNGATSILVPRFNVKSYAKLIKTCKPNFIAGVPTLYEAILHDDTLDGVDLGFLCGVFSGGDSLSSELKIRFDKFLDEHNSPVHIREGYGTTESVTACCLTPYNTERKNSIGFPFPDTYMSIFKPNTSEEMPYGEDGEICISGPSVMVGYMNRPEENANTLRTHDDGRIWLHTGDIGYMDEDGFIYFRQRLKRMIITSGYNVYPSQLESLIDAHEAVRMSCVIGVKDPYKIQKVKLFVVLNEGYEPTEKTKNDIFEYCKKNIAKYALPYEIEFRTELPKTLVGKIAYTVLEKEEEGKNKEN